MLPVVFDTLRKVTGESIVVVVSPLKILMADQVDSCSHKGLKSVSVCGDESSRQLYNSVINGNFQVVYISSEMLIGKKMWRDMLLSDCYQDRLVGVIIDEAHCVKKWGDDFRPEFKKLGRLRSIIPKNVNIMALTATATDTLRLSVEKILGMIDSVVIEQSPDKGNVFFSSETLRES